MSHQNFWVDVLRELQSVIKRANLVTWFKDTTIKSISDAGVMTIAVPTDFARRWLDEKYKNKVLTAAGKLDMRVTSIHFEVDGKLAGSDLGVDVKKTFSTQFEKKVRKVRNENQVSVSRPGGKIISRMLNQRYDLDNFVVSHENRLAHAACEAVVKVPGGIYNPLFIYGEVGMGKTHLLQAVGNGILDNQPDLVVKYITAERFVTEVVEAIGRRHMKSFKEKFRNVDCLLIDDVQFFARKSSSQQEFFHTFNELYEAGKQIVITSDCPPSELDDLDERLKSRFAMGMVVELHAPDFEARMAILKRKALEQQLVLDPEILDFIANNVTANVRVLEGVLKQVAAEMNLFNALPTISSVAKIIQRINRAHQIVGSEEVLHKVNNPMPVRKRAVSSDDIIELVADYFNLRIEDLTGQCRQKTVMLPRQICMYLIKKELGYSYEEIGKGLGNRNHTTVMHSYRKVSKMIESDVNLLKDLNSIKRDLAR